MKKQGPIYDVVTVRAIVQRINRRLKREYADGERGLFGLKAARSPRARQDLGDYYLLNLERNLIADTHVDLEKFGRELGVLQRYERVEEDEA